MCADWAITWGRVLEAYANTFYDDLIRPAMLSLHESQILRIYQLVRGMFGFTSETHSMMLDVIVLSNERVIPYRRVDTHYFFSHSSLQSVTRRNV